MTQQISRELKEYQWIRTVHPDEIESTKELERQAAKYPDNFILEGPSRSKRIALTFDDGPSEYTSDLLSILSNQQVHATFFLEGKKLAALPQLAQRAQAEGHLLGNHAYSHRSANELSDDELWRQEISQTNALFSQFLGHQPRWYRPPYGEIKDSQIEMLAAEGIKLALWCIDPRDWDTSDNSVETLVSSVVENLHDEAIILFHDGGEEPRNNTIAAVNTLIPICKSLGYELVTVEQLMKS